MAPDLEKPKVEPLSDVRKTEDSSLGGEAEYDLDNEDPRINAIKRKTDLRICTLLGLMYMMAAIDRVNLPVRTLLCFQASPNMSTNCQTECVSTLT